MDGLTLIRAARALGLTITVDGDQLVICGLASLEPVARALLDNKPAVMAALRDAEVMNVVTEWPEAARRHFANQVVVTTEGLAVHPGTAAWDVAAREANRIAAGVPIPRRGVPKARTIDHALAAFAALGGLKLHRIVKREQARSGAAEPEAKTVLV